MRLGTVPALTTPRLLLRPLGAADADAILSYRGRPDVCRYLPFEPHTPGEVQARLAESFARDELTAEGRAVFLGVEVTATGRLVGDVMLALRSVQNAGGELGYVFHPDVAGQGYATEAAAAVLSVAFDLLGLHRVVARLDARNSASARLAARLGMRQEAHLVSNELFKGEWSDELVFAMLDREWPGSPARASVLR